MGQIITLTSANGVELPNIIGDAYSAGIINAAQGTTPITLLTGNPGYIVTRLFVEVDASCVMASGGMVSINFVDTVSGQNVGQYRAYIPATFNPPSVPTGPQLASTGAGYYFRSLNPNSSLQVSVNNALTGGTIRCAVNYALIDQDT